MLAATLPRGSSLIPAWSSIPARRGPRKPIASKTRSAFNSKALFGTSCIAQRPSGPCSHSTRTHSRASIWPFDPSARLVRTAQSRSQPSSCEEEVRSFNGQSGQVIALFS